jgi:hypothetical protein
MENNSLQNLPELYRLPSSARQFFWEAIPAIASAASGGAGILSSILGGGGSKSGSGDIEEAARIRAQAAQEASKKQEQYYREAEANLWPWAKQMGPQAAGLYGGLTGLPGYEAVDRTEWLEDTPGYKFLTDQGMKGLGSYGAATGLMASGPAMKGALKFSQNLAQAQAWRPALDDVWRASEAGRGAATNLGTWAMGMGEKAGQYEMAGAQAEAEGLIQSANARAAQQQNQTSGLWGGLGMMAGGLGQLYSGYGGSSGLSGLFGGRSSGVIPGSGNVSNFGSGMGLNVGSQLSYPMNYKMMAGGGRINPNEIAVVGERGPEVFVPQRSGFIIPNHLLRYSAFDNYLKAA